MFVVYIYITYHCVPLLHVVVPGMVYGGTILCYYVLPGIINLFIIVIF